LPGMAHLASTNQYWCGIYLTNTPPWRIMYTLVEYMHFSMYWMEYLRRVTDLAGSWAVGGERTRQAVRSDWNLYGTFPVL
jgi:hypothetical protein